MGTENNHLNSSEKGNIISQFLFHKRYGRCFFGILLIFIGFLAYLNNIKNVNHIKESNYVMIDDYISGDVIIANGFKGNYRYIDFKLLSKKYEFATFRFKFIFNELDIAFMRKEMLEKKSIKIWIPKKKYQRILNKSKLFTSDGDKKLHKGSFQVYVAQINGEYIFNFEDLLQLQKDQKYIGLFLGLFGLAFLIPAIFVKEEKDIRFQNEKALLFSWVMFFTYYYFKFRY